jgi:hypothetical protein
MTMLRPEDHTVIGIDPGGRWTGVAVLGYDPSAGYLARACITIASTEPDIVIMGLVDLVDGLWKVNRSGIVLSVERFVVRGRAARSSDPAAGERARLLIGRVQAFGADRGHRVHTRTAAECKRWATDARLETAGLIEPSKGEGGHRRDAVRHALMTGVMTYGWPDPMSKTYRARHTGDDHGEVPSQH